MKNGKQHSVYVPHELWDRFQLNSARAKRRGLRYALADVVRDSLLAFCLHHEGYAPRAALDPRQLDLLDSDDSDESWQCPEGDHT